MGKIIKEVVCDSNKGFEGTLIVEKTYSTSAEDANFYKIMGLWFPKELFHDYLEVEDFCAIKKHDQLVDENEEEEQKPLGMLVCDGEKIKEYSWSTFTVGKEYPYYDIIGTQYYTVRDDDGDLVWAEQDMFHFKDVTTVDDGEEVYGKSEPDTEEEEDFSLKSFVHGVEHGTIVDYIVVGTRVNGEGLLLSTVSEEPAKDLLTSALNCLLEADGVQIKRTTDESIKLNSEDLRDIERAFPHVEQHGAVVGRINPEPLAHKDPLSDYADWFKKGDEYSAEILVRAMMTKNLAFVDNALDLIKRQEIAMTSYPTDFIEEQIALDKTIKEWIKRVEEEVNNG